MTPQEAKAWLQTTDDYQLDEETVIDALVTVATLQEQHAVEITDAAGATRYAFSHRKFVLDPESAWWTDEPQQWLADEWKARHGCTARVVRRFVSPVEVDE